MAVRRPNAVMDESVKEFREKLENIRTRLNEDGSEKQGRRGPIAPPIGYQKQASLVEMMRSMIRSERLAMAAEAAGYETFEESEDFDAEDDFDPSSPWENDFDPPIRELAEAGKAEIKRKQVLEAEKRARSQTPVESPSTPSKAPG